MGDLDKPSAGCCEIEETPFSRALSGDTRPPALVGPLRLRLNRSLARATRHD